MTGSVSFQTRSLRGNASRSQSKAVLWRRRILRSRRRETSRRLSVRIRWSMRRQSFRQIETSAWGASMRPIYTFHTVEEFWSFYNNIRHQGKLASGVDFYCFKDSIEPKWEDPICTNGGKWTINFTRGKSDTAWLYTGDEICGAVVNVRGRQEKVSLWTKNASNEAAQISIGKQ